MLKFIFNFCNVYLRAAKFCMNKWAPRKQFLPFIYSHSYSGKLVKVDYNSIVRMYMIVFDSLSSTVAFCICCNANGATQTAQRRKQSNPDPNPIPHPKPNPRRLFSPLRRLRCAICVAPNTDSLQCGRMKFTGAIQYNGPKYTSLKCSETITLTLSITLK